jgi:uncharacterized protein (UPF0332 family)
MFGLHYVKSGKCSKKSGKFYTEIFDKRITGDYNDFINYNENDAVALIIEPAKEFIDEIIKLILN